MPSKVSKVKANAIAEGSAGFLQPTFSSRRKAVDKTDAKAFSKEHIPSKGSKKTATKSQNLIQENVNIITNGNSHTVLTPVVIPTVQGSPLHSSLASHERPNILRSCLKSFSNPDRDNLNNLMPEVLDSNSGRKESENVVKIQDARRVCDELRKQIEDLKLQQMAFQSRISGEFGSTPKSNAGDEKQEKETENEDQSVKLMMPECESFDSSSEKMMEAPKDAGDDKTKVISEAKNNHLDPEMVGDSSSLTEDGFNLHGSVTSSDVTELIVKDEWLSSRGPPKDLPPSKVIKRLISERERYKKKVKHLQLSLHRLKKQRASHISRIPDIAARDIVYFNADLIGEGYLSYVYSGTIYKNQKAAIKKLIRPDMMSSSDRSYLAAEAGLLMALHHQNIVEVFGVSTAPLQPLILTEMVLGKSLHDRLHASNGWPLSPVEFYSTARDVCVGMAYLHGQKPPVLHLNLRPCNVLIDSSGRAKVSDFGFSKIRLDAGISNQMNLAYLAPELLRFPVHLTTKLDVFSYAVVLWEMSTMSRPFKDLTASEILDSVSAGRRLNIPCELPSGFHAIISKSWDHSPMQRPSFKEMIILLETMTLPHEWEAAIKSSGLNRTDTKGLITPRDNSNLKQNHDPAGLVPSSPFKRTLEYRQQNNPDSGAMKPGFKKLAEELALESDMISHGYLLPKPERSESENYLKGFRTSPNIPQTSNRPRNSHSGHQKLLMTSVSPYKHNFQSPPPAISPYYPRSMGHKDRFDEHQSVKVDSQFPYKAARNLIPELAAQIEDVKSDRDHKRRHCRSNGKYGRTSDQYKGRLNGIQARRKQGSRSSSETDTSFDGTNADVAPMPLSDHHFRYHSQDLTVETPKIVTGRGSKNHTKSKVVEVTQQSARSPEDLRTAVSIPYLKNLRSGDEISSASGDQTNRSQFDEKLSSYVSQACRAESRNYVDARMKGWRSDRSAILNKEMPLSFSDQVEVRSVASTTDNGLGDGSRRIESNVSESHHTVMTAQYKPDEERRKQLNLPTPNTKHDGVISPSTSEKSIDETKKIAVASIPSTSATKISTQATQYGDDASRIRHYSDGKSLDLNPRGTNQHRFLRRENSWNKLKNSYSPEPLVPTFASHFGTPPRTGGVSLPPALPGSETKESAFIRLPPNISKQAARSKKRRQTSTRRESYNMTVPANDNNADEVDRASNSTVSSATNDDVGQVLTETARELNGVSNILETAAQQHRQSSHKKRHAKKT